MLFEYFQANYNFGWFAVVVMSLIPLFGQLIMRIFYLYGSLDYWGFLVLPFFWFPPLSFVPILMGKYNVIKKTTKKLYLFIIVTFIVFIVLGVVYRCKILEYINLGESFSALLRCPSYEVDSDKVDCEWNNQEDCDDQDDCLWDEDEEVCNIYEE
jgi:hypothetical protein